MEPFKTLSGVAAPLPMINVDTDMIIPKQFLKTIKRTGLGSALFHEMRTRADGTPNPDFVLNRPEASGCEVLVAGRNFGCGSSREHAPWALLDYGIRAVISTEVADIFRGNALKNGLLPVTVDESIAAWLLAHPGAGVTIDLESATLALPTGVSVVFQIDAFARHCLLHGIDELGYLRGKLPEIERYEALHAGF
jgi:3-isopropylmalate/(R)-2-methylmalate dehydratase small subunit